MGDTRWRKIKCFFGDHALDCIKEERKKLVQRCLYCDKIIHEYTVTPQGAKKTSIIRRKY